MRSIATANLTGRIKLTEAKRLLRETRKPMSEVAFEIGMTSQSYFGAYFRKSTGMTPMEYRRQAQGNIIP